MRSTATRYACATEDLRNPSYHGGVATEGLTENIIAACMTELSVIGSYIYQLLPKCTNGSMEAESIIIKHAQI